MKCPECKNEIEHVNVISKCWQKATLEGNKMIDYGSVEDVLETLAVECPECSADITPSVVGE